MKDLIVEEIRKIRQAHAAKFSYNPTAICADLKEKKSSVAIQWYHSHQSAV